MADGVEAEIRDVLTHLLEGIKQADNQRVLSGMESVEGVLERNREHLHPQLVHFLERRSYAKALDYLGGDAVAPTASPGSVD